MINVKTNAKTGRVVAIKPVVPGDELMVITRNGIVNRQSVDGIRVIGRNTQGVRLVNLDSERRGDGRRPRGARGGDRHRGRGHRGGRPASWRWWAAGTAAPEV